MLACFGIIAAVPLVANAGTAAAPTPPPTPSPSSSAPPSISGDDDTLNVYDQKGKDISGNPGGTPPPGQSHPGNPSNASLGDKGPKIKNAPKDVKVQIKSEACSDRGVEQCSQSRAACDTAAGGNGYAPPTITWIKVDDGPWTYNGLSCGPPNSVTIPGAPGQAPRTVPVQAPPVPTFAQIQTAFRELPFSKPSVTVQPKDMRTLKNFTTFYAASWPNNSGLQPGETSKPIKLLSWTVEFKVAAQDYRYNFGDNKTSGWTSSPGGTYPDGDVTHKYATTGDMNVKIDARLTGQYRVNGGDWQDIATVADLQDEPVDTLEVVGTRTRLTSNEG